VFADERIARYFLVMNSSVGRILSVAFIFLAGYFIGSGRKMNSGSAVGGERDGLPTLQEHPSERVGLVEVVREGQFGDANRLPWTKERLIKTAQKLLAETNELSAIRPISSFADQLQSEDFPLALEVTKALPNPIGKRFTVSSC
jgi:hypothetical protein